MEINVLAGDHKQGCELLSVEKFKAFLKLF